MHRHLFRYSQLSSQFRVRKGRLVVIFPFPSTNLNLTNGNVLVHKSQTIVAVLLKSWTFFLFSIFGTMNPSPPASAWNPFFRSRAPTPPPYTREQGMVSVHPCVRWFFPPEVGACQHQGWASAHTSILQRFAWWIWCLTISSLYVYFAIWRWKVSRIWVKLIANQRTREPTVLN